MATRARSVRQNAWRGSSGAGPMGGAGFGGGAFLGGAGSALLAGGAGGAGELLEEATSFFHREVRSSANFPTCGVARLHGFDAGPYGSVRHHLVVLS